MSKQHRDETPENQVPILRSINTLCSMTEYNLSSSRHVRQAFLLGLWYDVFPDYMQGDVEAAQWWDYSRELGNGGNPYDKCPYENLQRFRFVADTGDSWHQCYRDLRKLGWERLRVHREGGRLKYLLKHSQSDMPLGYRDIHLVLDISIATCKQIQVGTEMKEVPVMKTVCEDLVEVVEEMGSPEPIQPYPSLGAEVTQLVVVDDIAEYNREEYEREHGPEGQIPSQSEPTPPPPFKDEIPF